MSRDSPVFRRSWAAAGALLASALPVAAQDVDPDYWPSSFPTTLPR